jgi:hypothetical protein
MTNVHAAKAELMMTLDGYPGEHAIRDRLKMAHSQPQRTPSLRRANRPDPAIPHSRAVRRLDFAPVEPAERLDPGERV